MTVTIVRDGGAVLVGEFGKQLVNAGDVILLGPNTLCGGEPEGRITMTTIYADTDYVVDQVFWQYVGMLQDRLDAQVFYAATYVEPAQILRLGEDRAESLAPWLDELVTLSIEGRPVENFYRMQALWFSITHVIAPFIKTSPIRTSSTQRATTWPTLPRHRRFTPLRVEAGEPRNCCARTLSAVGRSRTLPMKSICLSRRWGGCLWKRTASRPSLT